MTRRPSGLALAPVLAALLGAPAAAIAQPTAAKPEAAPPIVDPPERLPPVPPAQVAQRDALRGSERVLLRVDADVVVAHLERGGRASPHARLYGLGVRVGPFDARHPLHLPGWLSYTALELRFPWLDVAGERQRGNTRFGLRFPTSIIDIAPLVQVRAALDLALYVPPPDRGPADVRGLPVPWQPAFFDGYVLVPARLSARADIGVTSLSFVRVALEPQRLMPHDGADRFATAFEVSIGYASETPWQLELSYLGRFGDVYDQTVYVVAERHQGGFTVALAAALTEARDGSFGARFAVELGGESR